MGTQHHRRAVAAAADVDVNPLCPVRPCSRRFFPTRTLRSSCNLFQDRGRRFLSSRFALLRHRLVPRVPIGVCRISLGLGFPFRWSGASFCGCAGFNPVPKESSINVLRTRRRSRSCPPSFPALKERRRKARRQMENSPRFAHLSFTSFFLRSRV